MKHVWLLITAILISACTEETEILPQIDDMGLQSNYLDDYEIMKSATDHSTKAKKVELESEQATIKIESITGIEGSSAEIIIESRILGLNALYNNAISPYPGEISGEIVCDEEYMPQFDSFEDRDQDYVTLFATERMTYGACTNDLVAYRAAITWLKCDEGQTLHQVQFFGLLPNSKNEAINMIDSFRCVGQ